MTDDPDGPTLVTRCIHCLRDKWDGLTYFGPLERCTETKGPVCTIVYQNNVLLASLSAVLKSPNDPATTRTARVMMEEIRPSGHSCPLCAQPYVVLNGTVKVHFAVPVDKRPCPASYKRVIGGALDVKK